MCAKHQKKFRESSIFSSCLSLLNVCSSSGLVKISDSCSLVLIYAISISTFDLIGYSDADWAGCKIDRKSTLGTCQFLGRSLVSWASKKQNSVALSTAEAEYIAAGIVARNYFG